MDKAYWPVYGDIRLLDEILGREEICEKDKYGCSDLAGAYYSYIALILYMLFANVLLLNLLIAMFSNTFQKVQENTEYIWNHLA